MPAQNKRRVLILQRILPPYRLGFFQRLSQSDRLDVTLAYGDASKASSLESLVDPPGVRRVPVHNRYVGKDEMIATQSQTVRLVNSGQFDAVIAEFSPRILTNLLAYRAAVRRGIPFLWWGHGIRPKSDEIDIKIYLWMCKASRALILYTQDCADKLINRGVPAEKTFVAWNSIDTAEIEALRQPFIASRRRSIVCIGRLIADKKVDLLIRAFALAAPRLPAEMKLEVVGEGPERQKLEDLADELGIRDRVEFAGSIYDQAHLAPIFNRSLAAVSPGYVGLSAMHCLAFGVPMLVARDEPHSPEIVAIEDGVNSVLFQSDSADELADTLVASTADPERLESMSAAGMDSISRRFSIGAMVSAFEAAVEYACAPSAKPV